MQPERIAQPQRRPTRPFGAAGNLADPAKPLDERSMRALEILIAGLVLVVVALLWLVQPPDGQSLNVGELLALGSVLLAGALVSLIRSPARQGDSGAGRDMSPDPH